MPTIATGIAKEVRYKAEVTWGVAPGTGSAQQLRRVTSDLALKKANYKSAELARHYQTNDLRHGVRSVAGGINGELSAGTWKDIIAAAVRKAYAAVPAITGMSITIAGAGPTYTIARAAGSWLTDGIKKGQCGRLTAGVFNASNLNKNLAVLSLTALVLTVMVVNGSALVAEGPIAAATWTIPGKVTYAPSSGHTDSSFAIEHWHADVTQSELFLGCKVNELGISLPPTGMATINAQFLGKDMTPAAGSSYYVTPTAETTTGILAAANGLLVAQGGAIALATALSVSLKGNMSAEAVVGSNVYADIAEGPIGVDGSMSVMFDTAAIRDYFLNETEVSLIVVLSANPLAGADFMTITLPRIKFTGADKDDGPKSVVQAMPYTSLYNAAGGAGLDQEQTSIYIQDSQA